MVTWEKFIPLILKNPRSGVLKHIPAFLMFQETLTWHTLSSPQNLFPRSLRIAEKEELNLSLSTQRGSVRWEKRVRPSKKHFWQKLKNTACESSDPIVRALSIRIRLTKPTAILHSPFLSQALSPLLH